MLEVIHGTIHGKTIYLKRDPGVGNGQEVEVALRTILPSKTWGDGIRSSAGALADCPEMDAVMEEIQQERKQATFREVLELPPC